MSEMILKCINCGEPALVSGFDGMDVIPKCKCYNVEPRVYQEIQKMSIYDMLRRNRFSPVGDEIFMGETGVYFLYRMCELRDADPAAYARASRDLGWG